MESAVVFSTLVVAAAVSSAREVVLGRVQLFGGAEGGPTRRGGVRDVSRCAATDHRDRQHRKQPTGEHRRASPAGRPSPTLRSVIHLSLSAPSTGPRVVRHPVGRSAFRAEFPGCRRVRTPPFDHAASGRPRASEVKPHPIGVVLSPPTRPCTRNACRCPELPAAGPRLERPGINGRRPPPPGDPGSIGRCHLPHPDAGHRSYAPTRRLNPTRALITLVGWGSTRRLIRP